jgi:hypothetical protein
MQIHMYSLTPGSWSGQALNNPTLRAMMAAKHAPRCGTVMESKFWHAPYKNLLRDGIRLLK